MAADLTNPKQAALQSLRNLSTSVVNSIRGYQILQAMWAQFGLDGQFVDAVPASGGNPAVHGDFGFGASSFAALTSADVAQAKTAFDAFFAAIPAGFVKAINKFADLNAATGPRRPF